MSDTLEVTLSAHAVRRFRERRGDGLPMLEAEGIMARLLEGASREIPRAGLPLFKRDLYGLRLEILKRGGMTAWRAGRWAFPVRDGIVLTAYETDPDWWEPDE